MPGRPKTRAKTLTALEQRAVELFNDVHVATPRYYVDRPALRTPAALAWQRAQEHDRALVEALTELGNNARRKAGIYERSPADLWDDSCDDQGDDDCNGDGVVDSSDIDAFSALLAGPGAGGSAVPVRLTWDAENRLKAWEALEPRTAASRKLSFDYDWMGRRIEKKVSAWNTSTHAWDQISDTKYVWDGWLLLEELDTLDDNAPVRQYTWGLDLAGQNGDVGPVSNRSGAGGIGGLPAMYDVANSTGYGYFYNGNGDVGQVVKHSDGAIGAKYQYDPYGNTIASGGSLDQPWRFSTKQLDDESGLYYNDYRYYGPRWGRWASRDPMEEPGFRVVQRAAATTAFIPRDTNPLGPSNSYQYVSNRPTGRVDPLGLQECGCCGPDVSDWMQRELRLWYDWVSALSQRIVVWADRDAPWYEPDFVREKSYHYAFMLIVGPQLTYYPNTTFQSLSCPSEGCANSVTLCGTCIHSSEIGNIAYGAIARYFRMTWFQTWDGSIAGNRGKRTEADKAGVSIGYDFGDKGGLLCDHIRGLGTKEQHRLGSDAPKRCAPYKEKVNHQDHVRLPAVTDALKNGPVVIGMPWMVLDDHLEDLWLGPPPGAVRVP